MSASALCICFCINPAPLNGSTQFHYCTDSNPGTGADDAFVLKPGVWRNATWPLHSRPAIAASARHFQICFLCTFWPAVITTSRDLAPWSHMQRRGVYPVGVLRVDRIATISGKRNVCLQFHWIPVSSSPVCHPCPVYLSALTRVSWISCERTWR